MMKSNQRVPLSLGGPSHRHNGDFDDQTMMTEFTKQTTASAPPTLSKYSAQRSEGSSSRKSHHHSGRRRASTSFMPNSQEDTFDPFPNSAFSGAPVASYGCDWKGDRGSSGRRHTSRRSSAGGNSRMDQNAFADDPFASFGGRSSTTPKDNSHGRKYSSGQDDYAANFDAFDDRKSKLAPPAPMFPSGGMDINGVSEAFLFGGNGPSKQSTIPRSSTTPEISLPPLVGPEKRAAPPTAKENPLFSIPDPLSEHRQQQQEQEDFFASAPTRSDDFFRDPSFHASVPFSDDEKSEGDFSDEGTILWDEGGVIVSKAEKYNRSTGSLNASGSLLYNSNGNLHNSNGRLSTTSDNSHQKPHRRSNAGRKRLDGLERRNRGNDDDLTTATPSTRFSTDSESTIRSKKSTAAPGVELKTGSLLSDLVLIMDGKMEIPGGNDDDEEDDAPHFNDKGPRPSRRRSASGHEIGSRPSRRRSEDGDSNMRHSSSRRSEGSEQRSSRRSSSGGSDESSDLARMRQSRRRANSGDDSSDPFVVRQEVKGENMNAFAKVSKTKSGDFADFQRRPPGRSRSSDC